MAKPDDNVSKIAGWLRDFDPEKQAQLLNQIKMKAVMEAPGITSKWKSRPRRKSSRPA